MVRRPPISTLTDRLFPDTTRLRAADIVADAFKPRRLKLGADIVEHRADEPPGQRRRHQHRDQPAQRCADRREPRDRPLVQHSDDVLHIRSEEHTSELQSLMRISYAVFCLTKQKRHKPKPQYK